MGALSSFVTDHGIAFGLCSSFLDSNDFFPGGLFPSASWFVIVTVWAATRILPSSIEYLSARLYNSSIIDGGFKDSD